MNLWLRNLLTSASSSSTTRRPPRRQPVIGHQAVEQLEARALLTGVDCITANLSLYIDSELQTIPANIGVENGTQLSQIHTDENGQLMVEPIADEALEDQTLGDFFDTWRLNAGDAGNNPDAILSSTQLLDGLTDGSNTLQMFVNGQLTTEFENYVVQDGDEIVLILGSNPVVSLNTNYGAIVMELFETATPGTVENFLNYINDGDYDNSFVHRSVDDFVIQGGGFLTSSSTFTDTSQFTSVPTDPAIQNEPGISNLRGTVAMAKLGGDPDSATSQWFVNLADNSFLDTPANNEFTVFAQVLDMTTVDEIAALPINNEGGTFAELPYDESNTLAVVESLSGNGTLEGNIYFDTNGNDTRDTDEAGRAGATVYVDANGNDVLDTDELSMQTDPDGNFRFSIAPGTYDVRAVLNTGEEELTGSVQIGTTAANMDFPEDVVDPPTGVALANDSDTGDNDADNRTARNNSDADNTLDILVTGTIPGANVRVLANGNQVGTGVATGDSLIITTDGTTTLADGNVTLTAVQELQSVLSDESPQIDILIDTIAPIGVADAYDMREDVTLSITADNGLLANDSDANPLGVVLVDPPTNGSLVPAFSGSFNYTPANDFNGTDTFTYRATDGANESELITVTITVNPENDPPIGVVDSYNATEDTEFVSGNSVLDNDTDIDGDELTASLEAGTTNGTLSFDTDGTFTYTPVADFNGVDSFTYAVSDGTTEVNGIVVSISVGDTADPPVAEDDVLDVTLDAEQVLSVLQNDSDVDSTGFVIDSVGESAVGATITISDDETTLIYSPPEGFDGVDTFTYTIRDSDGLTDSATVTTQLSDSVAEASISGSVYVDLNENGIRDADEAGIPGVYIALREDVDNDTTVVRSYLTDDDGRWEFLNLPAGTYSVTERQPTGFSDGAESSAADGIAVEEDSFSNIVLSGLNEIGDLHFGESSISGGIVHVGWYFASSFRDGATTERGAIAQAEEDGGNPLLADQIRSGDNEFEGDLLSTPNAANDSYTMEIGQTLTVDADTGVLANDDDPDGQTLTLTAETQPENGTLDLADDGSFTYQPDGDFSGTDSFTYRITDPDGNSDIGTATITVTSTSEGFVVVEGAANGTSIGTVATPSGLGDGVVFQIEQVGVDPLLQIRANDQVSGSETASIILIEYLDFGCPACAALHPDIQTIKEEFEGDIMVVSRNFLVTGGNNRDAATAAEALSRQGLYDEMADQLFTNREDWIGESAADAALIFEQYAEAIGADLDQYRADLNDTEIQAKIDEDVASTEALGLTATPTLFLQGTFLPTPDNIADFAVEIQTAIDDLEQPFTINRNTGEVLVLDTTEIDLDVTPEIAFNVLASDIPGSTEVIDVSVEVSAALTGGTGGGEAASTSTHSQPTDGVFSELGDLLTVQEQI